jgi:HTH-type transcriptional repressor of NAD biosynthesis genes
MDVRPRRGLVVGKFCPLHRGHMLLIDTARAACDELLVISYTKPEFVGCAVEERAHWLATLYPGVRALVIDDATLAAMCVRRGIADHPPIPHNDADSELHRTFVGWLCLRLFATTVDAVRAPVRRRATVRAGHPVRAGRHAARGVVPAPAARVVS